MENSVWTELSENAICDLIGSPALWSAILGCFGDVGSWQRLPRRRQGQLGFGVAGETSKASIWLDVRSNDCDTRCVDAQQLSGWQARQKALSGSADLFPNTGFYLVKERVGLHVFRWAKLWLSISRGVYRSCSGLNHRRGIDPCAHRWFRKEGFGD